MSDNTIQREFVRSIVRGTYDIQKLRIQAGNRLTANYKIKLGIQPGKAEDEEKVASSILADIRKDYTRITDPIAAEALAKQGITPKKFKAEGMITSFLELSMANQYFVLLKTEEDEFKNLGKVLEDVPIYKEFLSNIPGIGPQIAGVLISEIDIHKAEYPSSLHKYCFPKGTMISTPKGMLQIEKLEVGEQVFDATGNVTDILETMTRKFTGNMIKIKVIGTIPLVMTDEHPVLVVRSGQRIWLEAKNIVSGDQLVVPKLHFEKNDPISWKAGKRAISASAVLGMDLVLNEEICYFFGRFIGDGSATVWNEGKYDRGICQLVFSTDETEDAYYFLNAARNLFGNANLFKTETGYSLRFGGATVAKRFQKWFGHLAQNKKIPDFILGLQDLNLIRAFIRGFIETDGHIVRDGKSRGTTSISSASECLIYQTQLLLTKLNVFGAIHKTKRKETVGYIRRRAFNQLPNRYHLSIPSSSLTALYPEYPFIVDGMPAKRKVKQDENRDWLLTVSDVQFEHVENIDVYNLKTRGSHTYLVQNVAVHNCGLDVIVIGKYTDKSGNEKTVRGDLIEAFYADGDYGKKMIIDGCMVELETVGRSRKGYSLVKREYETKDGQTASKDSITFNPWLKTKLIGVLAGNFLKQSAMLVDGKEMGAAKRTELAKSLGFKPTTKVELKPQKQVDQFLAQHGYHLEFVPGVYAEHYYNYKERLDNSPFHDEKTDLHKHNMALRFMIKRFLVDYYIAARKLEGLTVASEYSEGKLGVVHGKAKGLPDFQGLIGHVVKKRYDPSLFDMPEGV